MDEIKLYPHQIKAINNLRNAMVLCGSVGSGKSLTALLYFLKTLNLCTINQKDGSINFRDIFSETFKQDLYIITTARKRDTLEWDREANKLGLYRQRPTFNPNGLNMIIDSWNNIYKYCDISNAFFIFDEQRVVGSGSWVKSFLKIVKNNKWILLTATPGDTWLDYIPLFIAKGYFKNRTEFIRKHVIFNRYTKYPKVEKYLKTNILESYRDHLIIYMNYTKKISKHNEIIKVVYDKDLMNKVIFNKWNIYENEPIRDASKFCYILRKVANSDISRLYAIDQLLERHNTAVIFYNFNYELNMMRDFFKNKIEFKEWNGQKHESLPITKRWIYLVQYSAGAEGWNCKETDTIIFYSLNYSFKVMTQAAGRIDRIGTEFDVLNYYYLISDSTIDKSIQKALKSKKIFSEAVFYRNRF